MRNVAVCGSRVQELLPKNRSLATLKLKGYDVTVGLVETGDPDFDPEAAATRSHVLIKVRGFSCNYRDLSLIISASGRVGESSFYPFGSDAVGEVLAVGADVTRLKPGDRVISDNHYTGTPGAPEGVLTNHASKEYQVLPQERLAKIPAGMPDETAAAFSIGAQTTYSMLRRLELEPGMKVLVTAAKSNTSLFAINALKRRGVEVYATSTSRRFEQELHELGVRELIVVEPETESFARNEQMQKLLVRGVLFDRVIDPFFDLYLHQVIDLIASGGRYITCGLHRQFNRGDGDETSQPVIGLSRVMLPAMMKNLQLIGNCIGYTEDLTAALKDYETGELSVCIDSVFTGDAVGSFLERTYNAQDRLGKVVYLYDER
ncbi:MAG: zinc-binding alcohol dehydrogenase family protein [Pyrinomonadaceae bacterium]